MKKYFNLLMQMRFFALSLLIIFISLGIAAQNGSSSSSSNWDGGVDYGYMEFTNVKTDDVFILEEGYKIWIKRKEGKKLKGKFIDFSGSQITIDKKGELVKVDIDNVKKIVTEYRVNRAGEIVFKIWGSTGMIAGPALAVAVPDEGLLGVAAALAGTGWLIWQFGNLIGRIRLPLHIWEVTGLENSSIKAE